MNKSLETFTPSQGSMVLTLGGIWRVSYKNIEISVSLRC